MGEYRLPIRLLVGGALITNMTVWFFLSMSDNELEVLRSLGFALLAVGVGAFVTGIVLWPRSKRKAVPPPSEEPTAPDRKKIEG
jgi:hypothetical protein